MLELYQFELSHYSEKVRLILDYKGLEYRKIEVTPGIGQFDVYRLSGQRQVPVLKDGDRIIADSTEIAKYLDREYPDSPLIPTDPYQRGLCLMMEEWADESIGIKSRNTLLKAASQNQDFRTAWLPTNTPDFVKNLIGSVPSDLVSFLGMSVGVGPDVLKSSIAELEQDLEALCLLLGDRPYLVADSPTLADFAVAGLSMYIKFPDSPALDIPEVLKGKGVPALADNPVYQTFFDWRDRLYDDYRRILNAVGSPSPSGSAPTPIDIED